MLSYRGRVDRAYASAPVVRVNDDTRIVIMSDCHRGVGNRADDFLPNRALFISALEHYDRQGFTYIEMGDGDELLENESIAEIKAVHADVFRLLTRFYGDHRLWMLFGNHDIEKRCRPALFDAYCGALAAGDTPLFPGAALHEGLLLRYEPAGRAFFLLHGHQVDLLNDTLWPLAKFLVRNVWRRLELLGVQDPTSAAQNNKVRRKTEKRLMQWAYEKNIPVIAGHTHRSIFPGPGEGLYFNDGCCVYPGNITAIEIELGCVALVKWEMKTDNGVDGAKREVLAGPMRMMDYLQ